jgi:hypothetical protein
MRRFWHTALLLAAALPNTPIWSCAFGARVEFKACIRACAVASVAFIYVLEQHNESSLAAPVHPFHVAGCRRASPDKEAYREASIATFEKTE